MLPPMYHPNYYMQPGYYINQRYPQMVKSQAEKSENTSHNLINMQNLPYMNMNPQIIPREPLLDGIQTSPTKIIEDVPQRHSIHYVQGTYS